MASCKPDTFLQTMTSFLCGHSFLPASDFTKNRRVRKPIRAETNRTIQGLHVWSSALQAKDRGMQEGTGGGAGEEGGRSSRELWELRR